MLRCRRRKLTTSRRLSRAFPGESRQPRNVSPSRAPVNPALAAVKIQPELCRQNKSIDVSTRFWSIENR